MKPGQLIHIGVGFLSILLVTQCLATPAPGTRLHFRVLSAKAGTAPPFAAVDFIYGPTESIHRRSQGTPSHGQWWQFEIRTNNEVDTHEESQKQQRLMRRTVEAVEECFKKGEDFDIAADDGRPVKGYRRVLKLGEAE